MSLKNVIGRKIRMMISDPWDFGTECGVGPFMGRIDDADENRIMILLDHEINFSNQRYKRALCSMRHEGNKTSDLKKGREISVNIVLLASAKQSLNQIDEIVNGYPAIGSIKIS